ncbi:hypothetical protein A3D88_04580 [Candidatus Peribacteria bacterium RIFCSPHIGHO2_02_FULL_52_16]|nr:MAG: hypothetical protein A2706_03210 [Candidatus Peribacteria bacterium RIFCSPHIGHO2_01_FULL_51_35]OGJ60881.1 MAG: hypothetical protein A3D88_04580 [Candidatus Peribacteria bacterium RIFCSPHIGHO2_02_FULL_52_16]
MDRHFTATAFIVDSKHRTLLLWHKRLKRWMPPGGHVHENETPEETARRECKEETGLDAEIIGDPTSSVSGGLRGTGAQENLFDRNPEEGKMLKKPIALLLENIPASAERNEHAHQHMDFLYLARPVDENQMLVLEEAEGRELKWFTKKEIEALNETTEIFSNVKRYLVSVLSSKSETF